MVHCYTAQMKSIFKMVPSINYCIDFLFIFQTKYGKDFCFYRGVDGYHTFPVKTKEICLSSCEQKKTEGFIAASYSYKNQACYCSRSMMFGTSPSYKCILLSHI